MPQRRRRAYGLPRHAGTPRDGRLALSGALAVALLLAACPPEPRAQDLDHAARAIASSFADEEFCYLIPPRPMPGIFEPEAALATELARDHELARRLEAPLRRAVGYPIVTLAPSHPFDTEARWQVEPGLERVLLPLLWLYADYWAAARRAVREGEADAFAATALDPLRRACAAAVALLVFSGHEGEPMAAAYLSLLTGSVLARWPEGG